MAQSTKHASIFNIRNIRYGHVVIVGLRKFVTKNDLKEGKYRKGVPDKLCS